MATGKLTALAVEHAHREGQPVMPCDGGDCISESRLATARPGRSGIDSLGVLNG
jgi:hypothetical protein